MTNSSYGWGYIGQWLLKFIAVSFILMNSSYAQEGASPNGVQVSVTRKGDQFYIKASYVAPITICEAYAFLTDYEGAKNIPGIISSKVLKRGVHTAIVERLIEERVLFIPIKIESTLEYTELPNQGLNFNQIKGDSKQYHGTWRLQAVDKGTLFQYESMADPNSMIPNALIEYFIENSIHERFQLMADRATKDRMTVACR